MAFPTIDIKSRQVAAIDNQDHDFLRKNEFGMELRGGLGICDIPASTAVGTVIEVARFPAGASLWNVSARMVLAAPIGGAAFEFGLIVGDDNRIESRNGSNTVSDQGFTNLTPSNDSDFYSKRDWSPIFEEQFQTGIFDWNSVDASKQGVINFAKPFSLTMTVTEAAVGSDALIAAIYFVYSV